jgi:hypothetical protein
MSIELIIIGIIGIALVLLGLQTYSEGFTAGMPGIRCGVDLPTCNPGLQCFNGFCSSPVKPSLLANQLPVYP